MWAVLGKQGMVAFRAARVGTFFGGAKVNPERHGHLTAKGVKTTRDPRIQNPSKSGPPVQVGRIFTRGAENPVFPEDFRGSNTSHGEHVNIQWD